MNEKSKTLFFVAAALVAVGIAWASRPAVPVAGKDDVVGQVLAPELKDPLTVTSMEIIDFDPDTGSPKPFKVAKQKGVWSLPSHFDYPSDAQQQLAQAASSLMDLKILGLASSLNSDHAEFGVVDPGSAEPGAKGVGKHITLSDSGGGKVLDLIVGKEVKDQPKLRYVRKPGQDPVYIVGISTDKLSTRFDDWIEKDLLKVNGWDVNRVFINNYSIDEAQRKQVPGEKLDLSYSDKDSKWTLADLKEGEELDQAKLNEMKTAIDELKIVDVRKKPAGLRRDLRTDEGIALDEQTVGSLISKGYWPTQSGDLLSNEGEVVAGTKDGVEYVLRFGEVALGTEEAKDEKKDDAKKKEGEGKDDAGKDKKGANRYLFLMAQLNEDLIPKPELTPVPGESPAPPAATTPAAGGAAPAATPPVATPAESETKAPAAESKAPATPSPGPAGPEAENKPAEPAKAEGAAEVATEPEKKADAAPANPEVERIKADNKRKQDEYEEKKKKAQDKVKELNDRFADWYYVISDDVYKKIHLHRDDLMKKPDADKEAKAPNTPGEFDDLKEGIEATKIEQPAAPQP